MEANTSVFDLSCMIQGPLDTDTNSRGRHLIYCKGVRDWVGDFEIREDNPISRIGRALSAMGIPRRNSLLRLSMIPPFMLFHLTSPSSQLPIGIVVFSAVPRIAAFAQTCRSSLPITQVAANLHVLYIYGPHYPSSSSSSCSPSPLHPTRCFRTFVLQPRSNNLDGRRGMW